eukprot:Sdes_comp9873_c0_seq1m1410
MNFNFRTMKLGHIFICFGILSHLCFCLSGHPVEFPLDWNGSHYVGNLTIGSRGQQVSFLFDTGSSDAWMASTFCTGDDLHCGKRRFDCSPTTGCYLTPLYKFHTDSGEPYMDVAYGTAIVQANVSTVIMGSKLLLRGSHQTTVGMVFQSSGIFYDTDPFDGLLGMGPPGGLMVSDVVEDPKTPFQKLLLASELEEMFAFKLSSAYSFVTLGGYRHGDYYGEIIWMRTT